MLFHNTDLYIENASISWTRYGGARMNGDRLPWALESMSQIRETVAGRRLGFFLDFDGTLAPIASRPDLVALPQRARLVLDKLSESHLVCILSGRDIEDLRALTALPALFYAGDHGYRVSGPPGSGVEFEVGGAARGTLAAAAADLRHLLHCTEGVVVQAKDLSLSVHYRLTPAAAVPAVADAVREVGERYPSLRLTEGKLIFEFRPGDDWDKGRAMNWLVQRLGHDRDDFCPVCLGDDLTDEDTFLAARGWGISIAVDLPHRATFADYRLRDTDETI
jgi:trehalose 6-phosphate phosphatase